MNIPGAGTALCIALISANVAPAQERTEHSAMKQTLHFAGAGPHTLELRATTGSIKVEACDGRDAEMEVERSVSADTEDALRAADRDVILNTSENATLVSAIVREGNEGTCGKEFHDGPWYRTEPNYHVRFDFTVRVPADTRLQPCTINRGDVTVKGTRGDFSASRFKTINGNVVVSFPDSLAADLHLKSFHGGLYTDFDVQPLPAESLPTVEKRGGMSVYRTNGFTAVRVGNGGPS